MRVFLSTCILLSLLSVCSSRQQDDARQIFILNDSGGDVALDWINITDGSLVFVKNIADNSTFSLSSYVGHEFEIRQMGDSCESQQECRASTFVVGNSNELAIRVAPELVVYNQTVEYDEEEEYEEEEYYYEHYSMQDCQSLAMEYFDEEQQQQDVNKTDLIRQAIDWYLECAEEAATTKLHDATATIYHEATMRTKLGGLVENYTCADWDLETSLAVEQREWHHKDVSRNVHVMHERPASRIHMIENFISEEECLAMEEAAKPELAVAVVADGKGGTHYSPNRRAMQAAIAPDWDKESEGDHIATLSRRVYDYANHVLGLDLNEHGQEKLMSIQYFGRGSNDTSPDRYMPHCDGFCTGLPHKRGTRMATMVMYCTIPTKGGHTNFGKAGVHLKPVKGGAVFFSYIDPETKVADSGFTSHSGCPVIEGEKKIVTQWIRYGVDQDNPHGSFNSLGVKYSDAENQ